MGKKRKILTLKSKSEGETLKLAGEFAKGLSPKDVVLLKGTLGAGKTVFVKGVVEALGGEEDLVSSPTFTLVRQYDCSGNRLGIARIYHIDLYRLEKGQVVDLDLAEMLSDPEGVVLVEWAEKLDEKQMQDVAGFMINIMHSDDDSRQIEVFGF